MEAQKDLVLVEVATFVEDMAVAGLLEMVPLGSTRVVEVFRRILEAVVRWISLWVLAEE